MLKQITQIRFVRALLPNVLPVMCHAVILFGWHGAWQAAALALVAATLVFYCYPRHGNVPGHYEAVHQALEFCAPHEQPPFRVVDDATREASLQPVKAGAVLFNLVRKRIVQIQNSYREITRTGRGRVFDGQHLTRQVFSYRLPSEWQLVP